MSAWRSVSGCTGLTYAVIPLATWALNGSRTVRTVLPVPSLESNSVTRRASRDPAALAKGPFGRISQWESSKKSSG